MSLPIALRTSLDLGIVTMEDCGGITALMVYKESNYCILGTNNRGELPQKFALLGSLSQCRQLHEWQQHSDERSLTVGTMVGVPSNTVDKHPFDSQ